MSNRVRSWRETATAFACPLAAVLFFFAPARADYLFWLEENPGRIMRANLDGSDVQEIVTGIAQPSGLAVDPVAGKLYWADRALNIKRANLDGSNVEIVAGNGGRYLQNLAIDPYGRFLYFERGAADPDQGDTIWAIQLDGNGSEFLFITKEINQSPVPPAELGIMDLALHLPSQSVLWAESAPNRSLQKWRIDVPGSGVESLMEYARRLAVDPLRNRVVAYIWDYLHEMAFIQCYDLQAGSSCGQFLPPGSDPTLVIHIATGQLYLARSDSISRVNTDGSNMETVLSGLQGPFEPVILAVSDCDENGIDDWCDADCGPAGGRCDIPGCGTGRDCNMNEVLDSCEGALCRPPLLRSFVGTCTGSLNMGCNFGWNACAIGQGTCEQCGQNRYLSFGIPESTAGLNTAIRIRLVSLHHPQPPPSAGSPPDFTLFEGGYRYLNTLPGAVSRCCDPASNPMQCAGSVTCTSDADCGGLGANTQCETNICPDNIAAATYFRCASVGCEPEYRDWASEFSGRTTYATGSLIVPSSIYHLANLPDACAGNEELCPEASAEIEIKTERWGNLDCSNSPTGGIPTASDVAREVDACRGSLFAFSKPMVQLREHAPNPLGLANAQDLARIVDAAKGANYPFHFHCTAKCNTNSQCPGSSCVNGYCGAAPACTTDANCASLGFSSAHSCSANGFCTNAKDPCTGLCQP